MFIAPSAHKDLAPLGAKRGSVTIAEAKEMAIALLRSLRIKKGPPGYKHLAPLGRSDNKVPLHFQIEFENVKWKMTNGK